MQERVENVCHPQAAAKCLTSTWTCLTHVLYPQGHLFKVPRAFPHTEVLAPELSAWLFSLTSTYAQLKATLYKLQATCTPQLWTNPCSSAPLWSPRGLVSWGLPGFRSCLDLRGQRAGPSLRDGAVSDGCFPGPRKHSWARACSFPFVV